MEGAEGESKRKKDINSLIRESWMDSGPQTTVI